ncbi:hypothetical protein SKAU_G00280860, partial [Synaphobranchus kaupii]
SSSGVIRSSSSSVQFRFGTNQFQFSPVPVWNNPVFQFKSSSGLEHNIVPVQSSSGLEHPVFLSSPAPAWSKLKSRRSSGLLLPCVYSVYSLGLPQAQNK